MKMQIVALGVLAAAGAAYGSNNITTAYSFSFEGAVNATTPFTGPASFDTGRLNGDRLDLPPGLGVDTTIPDLFTAFCVEIGVPIQNPGAHKVFPLLGSVTDPTGGVGPAVLWDPVRTQRASRLWGGFIGSVNSIDSAGAFQLALWDITYDIDMDLSAGPFFVGLGQFQPGVTDLAQSWLNIVNSAAILPEPELFLLSGPDNQDVITTPAPGTLALLGLSGLVAGRRRR
ncbi:MAG: PEP-CTERM sorting domain-containing protein [Phycisphaerales bacterium]